MYAKTILTEYLYKGVAGCPLLFYDDKGRQHFCCRPLSAQPENRAEWGFES